MLSARRSPAAIIACASDNELQRYPRVCAYMYLLLALNTLVHHVRQRSERDGGRVVVLLLLLLLLLLLMMMMTLVILLRDDRPHERARLRHPGLRPHLRLLSATRVRRGPRQFHRRLLRGDAGVSGGVPRRVPAVQRRGPFFVGVSLQS